MKCPNCANESRFALQGQGKFDENLKVVEEVASQMLCCECGHTWPVPSNDFWTEAFRQMSL
jgi:hypothetical protein